MCIKIVCHGQSEYDNARLKPTLKKADHETGSTSYDQQITESLGTKVKNHRHQRTRDRVYGYQLMVRFWGAQHFKVTETWSSRIMMQEICRIEQDFLHISFVCTSQSTLRRALAWKKKEMRFI